MQVLIGMELLLQVLAGQTALAAQVQVLTPTVSVQAAQDKLVTQVAIHQLKDMQAAQLVILTV